MAPAEAERSLLVGFTRRRLSGRAAHLCAQSLACCARFGFHQKDIEKRQQNGKQRLPRAREPEQDKAPRMFVRMQPGTKNGQTRDQHDYRQRD